MTKTTGKKRTSRMVMAAAFLAGAFFLVLAIFLRGDQPSHLLLGSGRRAPDFFLQDRTGRMFSSFELLGNVWVADFIFTHCAGTCPFLAKEMTAVLNEWPNRPDFKLVSFTVDPARDTVEVLNRYAEDLHAEDTKWRFLTGKKEDLYKVIQLGFLESVGEVKDPEKGFEFTHSSKIVLVDRDGMIRGFYDIEREGETKLMKKDIQYLLNQKVSGAGEGLTIRIPAPKITVLIPIKR